MAIDKSKENTRIADFLAMSTEDLELLCAVGLNNPAINKQFASEEAFKWEYAAAAGLISWDDVKWIKENVNEEETETNEPAGN